MRSAILMLVAAAVLSGQDDVALFRLKHEAAQVKTAVKDAKDARDEPSVTALHRALREWIESRLPTDKGLLSVKSASLESSLQADLTKAGLAVPDGPPADAGDDDDDFPGFGTVEVHLTQFPELPDTLFVTAGASAGCGVDEAVYGYHFDTLGRTNISQDRAEGFSSTDLELSDPDAAGRRLLLVHRMSIQCASMWMGLAYSVYRMGFLPGVAERLLSEKQGVYLGNDELEFVLKPEELIVEFLDRSVDVGVHNRTQIHRYRFANGVQRLDPVAFQPQDFAEEWLGRPWSEMQSRSAPETADWHCKLHADYVLADYSAVVPCAQRPGRWLIALDITDIGEKKFEEPLETYFLVRDLGNYRYQMEAVSDEEPAGCPGEMPASEKHPWLSPAELKALR